MMANRCLSPHYFFAMIRSATRDALLLHAGPVAKAKTTGGAGVRSAPPVVRRCTPLAIGLALAGGLALGALAQTSPTAPTYPSKPIRVITPNSTGSAVDNVTRRLVERLGASLGQSLVVENLTGAGGIIGTEALIRAPKDGYTLAVVASNHVIFPHLHKKLSYDPIKDITPIALVGSGVLVMVARASFAANDYAQLAEFARRAPGTLTMGSSGNGTVLHLAGEMMQRMGNFELLHIPYRGVAAVLPDVLSGAVDVAFFGPPSVAGLLRDGRLKALGVTSTQRSSALPNVPTIAESGLRGYQLESWIALIGPADLPEPPVQRLQQEVTRALGIPEFRDSLSQIGITPATQSLSAAQMRTFFADEFVKHGKLVASSGTKLD